MQQRRRQRHWRSVERLELTCVNGVIAALLSRVQLSYRHHRRRARIQQIHIPNARHGDFESCARVGARPDGERAAEAARGRRVSSPQAKALWG